MRALVKIFVVLLVLGILGGIAFHYASAYWKERNKPRFRTAAVTRGDVLAVVNSTGTIEPVRRVQVGSFVSGPIAELPAYFGHEVKQGQLLAKIDPTIYEANMARDNATLATRKADVQRVRAMLEQATRDEERSIALRKENKDYISDTELDKYKYSRMSLDAQLAVAEAAVLQAEANLKISETNVGYTNIIAPEDGIIIDCKIEKGQTMAASFQTPELFVIGPNMREEIHVKASVDEADIGLIRKTQEEERKVEFTVDAYPDDLFEGKIYQIRMNPTTLQNVVSYPVMVKAPNPDLKLLPGMTASLSCQVDERKDVLRIPNAALRYYPKLQHVREEDRKLLEGTDEDGAADDENGQTTEERSAAQRAKANQQRNQRHVWVVDGEKLKAVKVEIGLMDRKWAELVKGDLEQGQKLVVPGEAPKPVETDGE